ncbi:MAG: hypothetical protein ACHP7J_00185 [Terriglobales bacterium]
MRLITRAELLKEPLGTIFREFEPFVWKSEWMRLIYVYDHEAGDFDYNVIGPEIDSPDGEHENGAIGIRSDNVERDGAFDDEAAYVVLDAQDVEAWVNQLTGKRANVECVFPTWPIGG